MKKGRPAHTVSALADPALSAQVAEVLAHETGSLGVRGATIDRWPSARETDTVDVAGFPVRVKVSPGRVKVEHDDAARVAGRVGLPLREVISLAEEAGRRSLRHRARAGARPARPRASPPLRITTTTTWPDTGERFLATARHDGTVPVPVETCEACRFDGAQYDLPDTLGTLRALGPMWRRAVEGVDAACWPLGRQPACGRPPSTWHSAEVAEIHRLGLEVLIGSTTSSSTDGGVELGDPDTSAGMRRGARSVAATRSSQRRPSPPPSRTTTRAGDAHVSAGRAGRTTPPGSSATPSTTSSHHLMRRRPRASTSSAPARPPRRAGCVQLNVSDGGVPKKPIEVAEVGDRGLVGDRQAAAAAPRPSAPGAVPLVERRHRRAARRGPPDRARRGRREHHREPGSTGRPSGPARSSSSATSSRRSPRGRRRARRTRSGSPTATSTASTTTATPAGAAPTPGCASPARSARATPWSSSRSSAARAGERSARHRAR